MLDLETTRANILSEPWYPWGGCKDVDSLFAEIERLRAESEGLNAEIDHADNQYRQLRRLFRQFVRAALEGKAHV